MSEPGTATLPKKSCRITASDIDPSTKCLKDPPADNFCGNPGWDGDVVIDAAVCNMKLCACEGEFHIIGDLKIECQNMVIEGPGTITCSTFLTPNGAYGAISLVPATTNYTLGGVTFLNCAPA